MLLWRAVARPFGGAPVCAQAQQQRTESFWAANEPQPQKKKKRLSQVESSGYGVSTYVRPASSGDGAGNPSPAEIAASVVWREQQSGSASAEGRLVGRHRGGVAPGASIRAGLRAGIRSIRAAARARASGGDDEALAAASSRSQFYRSAGHKRGAGAGAAPLQSTSLPGLRGGGGRSRGGQAPLG